MMQRSLNVQSKHSSIVADGQKHTNQPSISIGSKTNNRVLIMTTTNTGSEYGPTSSQVEAMRTSQQAVENLDSFDSKKTNLNQDSHVSATKYNGGKVKNIPLPVGQGKAANANDYFLQTQGDASSQQIFSGGRSKPQNTLLGSN